MLYEPLPGSAAIILAQLGIIEQGQVGALGARTYDAESARLSLALDDGRTVELERAMHLHTENGYAVRIRSRAGQTISRSFIHIDRDLGVRNLYNDRMVYIDDADLSSETADPEPSEAQIEADADHVHESQSHEHRFPLDETMAEAEPLVASMEAPATLQVEDRSTVEHEAFDSEPLAVAERSSETPAAESEIHTEMLEILPEADGATILYFYEGLNQAPEEAASAPVSQAETEPPEPLAASAAPRSQASEQVHAEPAETPVAASSSEATSSSEAVAVVESRAQESTPVESARPEEASQPEPAASAETIAAVEPEPSEAEPEPAEPDPDPEYAPLHAALAPAEAADFLFVAQTGTIHTYEHRRTLRYIHIDAPSGLFYDQTRTPISRAAALRRALIPQPAASLAEVPEEQALTSPGSHPANPLELQAVEAPPSPAPDHHTEPELRTRRIPAARAAVKPEPAPEAVAQDANHGLSLDAFTRKHGTPLERQTLRNRIGDLSRVFRLGRNQNGSNSDQDS